MREVTCCGCHWLGDRRNASLEQCLGLASVCFFVLRHVFAHETLKENQRFPDQGGSLAWPPRGQGMKLPLGRYSASLWFGILVP